MAIHVVDFLVDLVDSQNFGQNCAWPYCYSVTVAQSSLSNSLGVGQNEALYWSFVSLFDDRDDSMMVLLFADV